MTKPPDRLVADMPGPAALPRKNGELLFDAPWQARAFGMAVALSEGEAYTWDEFQRRLVARISAAEPPDVAEYYHRWLASFETLLVEKGLLVEHEIASRAAELAARAPEDDHTPAGDRGGT